MATKAKEMANLKSCLSKADPEEPIFVLRGQDASAPSLVRIWAVEFGKRNGYDHPKYNEAIDVADAMENWHRRKQPD